jgi:hypothetical protein
LGVETNELVCEFKYRKNTGNTGKIQEIQEKYRKYRKNTGFETLYSPDKFDVCTGVWGEGSSP